MPIIDAYAQRKKRDVMEDSWGHLRPEPRRVYRGTIVFAHGEYGDIVAIRSDFEDLPASPWFYADLHDFIGEHCLTNDRATIFRFSGTYKAQHNDRKGVFDGKIETIAI